MFLDQGSIPGPLHWKADSQPLDHQRSPQAAHLLSIHHVLDTVLSVEVVVMRKTVGGIMPFKKTYI